MAALADDAISAVDSLPRRRVRVGDSEMSYVDTGGPGPPIVFLHGNPTWSYLWRNIIPAVRHLGRCLAPDLIGMGQSAPSPSRAYRFVDHAGYLDHWFEALGLTQNITLVLHDWGSALGFHRAFRHPRAIRAIAYMEAMTRPRRWADVPAGRDQMFRALRSREGEHLALDQNYFIEIVLPKSILRQLGDEEMAAYRRPFATRESRLPTLVWPRELPLDGEPADVVAIVDAYGAWLAQSPMPKLFINAEPGSLLVGRSRDFCRTWPNQREVTVQGIHFVQEDAPREIAAALQNFLKEILG